MKRMIMAGGVMLLAITMALAGCEKSQKEEAPAPAETRAPAEDTQPAAATAASDKSGQELFGQHCAACHPDGSNIIKPEKTLHKSDLAASGIKTAEDIVATIRNPGPGMPKLDSQALADAEARKIAEYILESFQ